jgi:hypothetical protein
MGNACLQIFLLCIRNTKIQKIRREYLKLVSATFFTWKLYSSLRYYPLQNKYSNIFLFMSFEPTDMLS